MFVKMLWNPIVPTKVGFFAWEVWWGKILTMNQLQKRGFSLASRCTLQFVKRGLGLSLLD